MGAENDLRRLGRYGLGKLPDPSQPGYPGPHGIGDPTDPAHGGDPGGDVGDNPYKLDPYWGHPTPGPGFDPDETHLTPEAPYMHSMATRALRQAHYGPTEGNQLIRLARRGQLAGLQGPGGAYHDPHDPTQNVFDPTPRQDPTDLSGYSDPKQGDERPMTAADPGYYGGFKSPEVQQQLEAVSARWAPRRAARAARQAAHPGRR